VWWIDIPINEVAVLALETRGGGRADREEVWDSAFDLDCGMLFGPVGLHGTEAAAIPLNHRGLVTSPRVTGRNVDYFLHLERFTREFRHFDNTEALLGSWAS
jgi:hypothetical protein